MTAPIPPARRQLAVIRAALLGGVLLFGVVAWLAIRRRGGGPVPGVDVDAFGVFRTIVPVLCVAALGVAVAVRFAIARATDAGRRNALRMIGWAAGEMAALAGGVHFFQVGDPKLYVLGLTAMLATFIVVPLRDV